MNSALGYGVATEQISPEATSRAGAHRSTRARGPCDLIVPSTYSINMMRARLSSALLAVFENLPERAHYFVLHLSSRLSVFSRACVYL